MLKKLGSLVLVASGAMAIACGSSDNGGSTSPGGDPPNNGPPPGTEPGTTPGLPDVNGPLTFTDRLIGWSGGYTGGFYTAHGYAISNKRLFSMPDALSSTLRAVTVVDIAVPAKPRVYALPVTGKVPMGTIEAFTYDPSSDRVVIVVRSRDALNTTIATLEIAEKAANFTILTQANAPNANAMIGPLFATGAPGVIAAGLGDSVASFTVSGTSAAWSAETAGSLFPGNAFGIMEDAGHSRILSIGTYVFDPGTTKVHVDPAVKANALAAPYAWTPLPFAGEVPPQGDDLGYNFSVYDATGNRVLASFSHDATCFPGQPPPCKAAGLWSFDLAANTWKKIVDAWSGPHLSSGARPFLVDQANRRILEPSDGGLLSASLDPSNPTLADVSLTMDGDLGPSFGTAAATTVLGDGRLVSTDGVAFRVLDAKEIAPRWTRFGTAQMPSIQGGASIVADAKTGEIVVFGAARPPTPGTLVTELYVLSADGKSITKVPEASVSAPPTRTYEGALVVDGTLYIAGGLAYDGTSGSGGAPLGDVWAFDRASGAAAKWTKIATLPSPVWYASVGVGADGALIVSGRVGTGAQAPSKLYAIDRSSHAITTMDGAPTTPLWSITPYRGCFLGYESSDTVDGSGPTVWRCTIDGGAAKWSSSKLDEHDFSLHDLRSASSPDGLHAYFVGRHLWDVVGK